MRRSSIASLILVAYLCILVSSFTHFTFHLCNAPSVARHVVASGDGDGSPCAQCQMLQVFAASTLPVPMAMATMVSTPVRAMHRHVHAVARALAILCIRAPPASLLA